MPTYEAARAAAADLHDRHETACEYAALDSILAWTYALQTAIRAQLSALTAAAWPEAANADVAARAAEQAFNTWAHESTANIIPTVEIAFGEAFQQARRRAGPDAELAQQLEFMADVSDRLRIWPDNAFDELRPELLEILSDADTVDHAVDRIGAVLGIDAESDRLRAELRDVTDPAERKQMWADHDEALRQWRWKARRIARTEIHGAVIGGQIAAARAESEATGQRFYKRWLATNDVRVRPSHAVADGQIVDLDGKFRVGGYLLDFPGEPITIAPHETINCVVGSTDVAWPGQNMAGVTRRRHTGTFVDLVTANGHNLTVTANHPVLTPTGYVAAHTLRPTDQVIATGVADAPQIADGPARVEQLYETVREARVGRRVVLGRMDFHGDVTEHDEVEVVRADRDLFGERHLDGSQIVGDGDVVGLPRREVPGAGRRTRVGRRVLDRVIAWWQWVGSTSGDVRRGRKFSTLVDGQPGHAKRVRLTGTADGQPESGQPPADGWTADADNARHLQHADAVGMQPTQLIDVNVYSATHDVYNLSTEQNWYIANGIAVHNCRCTLLVMDADELADELESDDADPTPGEGHIRYGTDDADEADAAIEAMAEELDQPVPTLGVRGEDRGQSVPVTAPPEPRPLDEYDTLVDLTQVSDTELEQYAEQAVADGTVDDALFRSIMDELERRHENRDRGDHVDPADDDDAEFVYTDDDDFVYDDEESELLDDEPESDADLDEPEPDDDDLAGDPDPFADLTNDELLARVVADMTEVIDAPEPDPAGDVVELAPWDPGYVEPDARTDLERATDELEAALADPDIDDDTLAELIAAADAAEQAEVAAVEQDNAAGQRMAALLERGYTEDEIDAAARGIDDMELYYRERFIDEHAERYGTRSFDRLIKAVHMQLVADVYLPAMEEAIAGANPISREYRAVADASQLWFVNENTLRAYVRGSQKRTDLPKGGDEVLKHFDEVGRVTQIMFREMVLSNDYTPRRSASGRDYLQ